MANFIDKLIGEINKKNSVVCVGLDPRLSQIPEFIKNKFTKEMGYTLEAAAYSILEFNKGIIDAVADIAVCVKPQIAFYEQYGFEGYWAFEATIDYARKKGLLVIADAKRNDIGSTAEAYADGFLGQVDLFGGKYFVVDADALTVNPYLGGDGILPFLKACREFDKGIFVLLKTSNPSSGDLQDRIIEDTKTPLYELVASLIESYGADLMGKSGYSSVGAVVGATFQKQALKIREILPNNFFLIPGYGAQGGKAADLKGIFDANGLGAIVNNSRGIIFAYESAKRDEKAYMEAAKEAAKEMQKELNKIR